MNNTRSLYIIQIISIAGYLLCAAFFVFIAVMDANPLQKNSGLFALLSGVLFWAGLITGAAGQVVLLRKTAGAISGRIGLISFCTNRFGFIADAALVLSFIGTVLSVFLSEQMGIFSFIIWSLFIFSFSMHCVLNGRKFNYIYRQKIKSSVRNEKSA